MRIDGDMAWCVRHPAPGDSPGGWVPHARMHGKTSRCKECERVRKQEYRHSNPQRVREAARRRTTGNRAYAAYQAAYKRRKRLDTDSYRNVNTRALLGIVIGVSGPRVVVLRADGLLMTCYAVTSEAGAKAHKTRRLERDDICRVRFQVRTRLNATARSRTTAVARFASGWQRTDNAAVAALLDAHYEFLHGNPPPTKACVPAT